VFHCHNLFHIDPQLRLTPAAAPDSHDGHDDHSDGERHMAGLTLAIAVTPAPDRDAAPAEPANPRQLKLEVGTRVGITYPSPDDPKTLWPGLGYHLAGDATATPFVSPGPTLVLTRGEPVAISVVNRLDKTTTVHWHGIELQSYYDGVSGIGGSGDRRTPAIAPGQTFVARFTPPRAGTFMYHTHLNDYQQVSTGLYGVIVVTEPGERFDPDVEKIFVLGRGPDDDKDPVLINGSEWPNRIELKKNQAYRFRFAGRDVAVVAAAGEGWQIVHERAAGRSRDAEDPAGRDVRLRVHARCCRTTASRRRVDAPAHRADAECQGSLTAGPDLALEA
jgi:hypothetical protein